MPPDNFEKFFDLSLDMLCIVSKNGNFESVNASFRRTLGWTPDDLTGRPFVDFIHPDDVGATLQQMRKLGPGLPAISFRNRFQCSNGSYRFLLWTASLESETGLLFAIARDTTELIEADQRFRLAIDASPVALIMVDQRGLIQLVNRETERLFGYSRDDLIGKPIEILVPANRHVQHERDRAEFFQHPSTRLVGAGRQLRAMRRDGILFPAEIGLNPAQFGDEIYVLSTVIDLTLQKQAEERVIRLAKRLEGANARLAQLAVTDRLTNILNRRAFDEQLDKQIQLMSRVGRALSLLMIDVDHFKQYNDQFGHPAGDGVFKIIARLLLQNARATDVVARYGGEEFAVIMPDSNEAGALQMAERFRTAIHAHPWEQVTLTVSMGISTILFRKGADRKQVNYSTQLVAEADRALYHSKHNGRDQVTHVSEMQSTDQAT